MNTDNKPKLEYKCNTPITEYSTAYQWVVDNVGPYSSHNGACDWDLSPGYFYFKHEYDAVAFKLKFR